MADSITPFEWQHIEQQHYECHWHGMRLVANQDMWQVTCNGLERRGHPRTQASVRMSAARRAEVARTCAEGYAYRRFLGGQSNER